jgi:hypothetical protein
LEILGYTLQKVAVAKLQKMGHNDDTLNEIKRLY